MVFGESTDACDVTCCSVKPTGQGEKFSSHLKARFDEKMRKYSAFQTLTQYRIVPFSQSVSQCRQDLENFRFTQLPRHEPSAEGVGVFDGSHGLIVRILVEVPFTVFQSSVKHSFQELQVLPPHFENAGSKPGFSVASI